MDMKEKIEYFKDKETGKTWALYPGRDNYLESFLGFCPTCGKVYTSRYSISAPNKKVFIGNRCKTYWDSINPKINENIKPLYCGHDEKKGWKSFEEAMKDNCVLIPDLPKD